MSGNFVCAVTLFLSGRRKLSNFAKNHEARVMKRNIGIKVARILLISLAVILAGCISVLQNLTMSELWKVLLVSSAVALPLALIFVRRDKRLVPFSNVPMRFVVWFLFMVPVLAGTFYLVNYLGADKDNASDMPAVVESKYYEIRHRSRRVGRRYVSNGEPYNVYYADLRLADGHHAKMRLTGAQISSVRAGEEINVKIASGMLGIPVIIKN